MVSNRFNTVGKMTKTDNYLYSDTANILQIPYMEYATLVEEFKKSERSRAQCSQVVKNLAALLRSAKVTAEDVQAVIDKEKTALIGMPAGVAFKSPTIKTTASSSVEAKASPTAEKKASPAAETKTDSPSEAKASSAQETKKTETKPKSTPKKAGSTTAPPLKADIVRFFKAVDASGSLFELFEQHYLQLNESCGGTVCVSLKDGICNIMNYDAWTDFAFIDVLDGRLRISVSERYKNEVSSFDACEVPRLLARNHKLVGILVDAVDQVVLDVLVMAFDEVGASI